jgi:hypothetical protein
VRVDVRQRRLTTREVGHRGRQLLQPRDGIRSDELVGPEGLLVADDGEGELECGFWDGRGHRSVLQARTSDLLAGTAFLDGPDGRSALAPAGEAELAVGVGSDAAGGSSDAAPARRGGQPGVPQRRRGRAPGWEAGLVAAGRPPAEGPV